MDRNQEQLDSTIAMTLTLAKAIHSAHGVTPHITMTLSEFIRIYGPDGVRFTTVEEEQREDSCQKDLIQQTKFYRDAFKTLVKTYDERRTDVAEFAAAVLAATCYQDTDMPKVTPESRYISADVPGTPISIRYDTLTTHLEYTSSISDAEWHDCDGTVYADR